MMKLLFGSKGSALSIEVADGKVVLHVQGSSPRYQGRWSMCPSNARKLATFLWRSARWLEAQSADDAALLAQAEADLDDVLKGTG